MDSSQQSPNKTEEYGVVEELRYPLAFVRGLPNVSLGEMVVFEGDGRGQVMSLKEEYVEVMMFSQERIIPGTHVRVEKGQMSITISEALRGKAISPLGTSLFSGEEIVHDEASKEVRPVDATPPHISSRCAIKTPIITGTAAIDLLLTLGKGQREAVLGDPTTGKASFLLTTVRAQSKDTIVIYAMIGKPWNDIKRVYNFIEQYTNKENVVLIGTGADEVSSLTYLTPLAAMTLAEYWRDKGKHTLVVMDDMTTHAKFYREMALLARRFPARESYPGDIFHLHARLMERAGNFKHGETGEASISCLPVVETVREDMSNYIVSNLISITDGHLLFDEEIFSRGRRPAINIPLSVTRVGGNTRTKLQRELHRKLTILLTKHEEAQNYTHFGAVLHEDMQRILEAGDRFLEFLSQPLFLTVPSAVQVVVASMIWMGWLNGKEGQVNTCRKALSEAYEKDPQIKTLCDTLFAAEDLDSLSELLKQHRQEIETVCQQSEESTKK